MIVFILSTDTHPTAVQALFSNQIVFFFKYFLYCISFFVNLTLEMHFLEDLVYDRYVTSQIWIKIKKSPRQSLEGAPGLGKFALSQSIRSDISKEMEFYKDCNYVYKLQEKFNLRNVTEGIFFQTRALFGLKLQSPYFAQRQP